jgi:hypothetical protein
MRMKNPPHPGRSIRTACLEPLGLLMSEERKRILGEDRIRVGGRTQMEKTLPFRLMAALIR